MTPEQLAAGVEKMARASEAACAEFYAKPCPPRSDVPIDCHRYIANAMLTAWEQHLKDTL